MTDHSSTLPHTSGRTVVTDSGLETDLIFSAEQLVALRDTAGLTVLGGCCGTDARHVRALAARVTGTVWMPRQAESAASTSSRGIPSRNSTASR